MSRTPIELRTLRALFARSGNCCAFPGCSHPLLNDDNIFIAQVCHIEAVSNDGPRFNRKLKVGQINAYENLLLLCYRHHRETDNLKKYSVSALKRMKASHEKKFKEENFKIDDQTLRSILEESSAYWKLIHQLNTKEHVIKELRVPIHIKKSELKLVHDLRETLNRFHNSLNLFTRNLGNEYFELTCLAIPNFTTRMSMLLHQLEIRILEEKLKANLLDKSAVRKLAKAKKNFAVLAQYAGLAD